MGLVEPVQKVTLVLAGVKSFKQFVALGKGIEPNPRIVASGYFFSPQAHGMVQKGLELDLGVAQNIGVGGAPAAVLAQKLGKHPVFVLDGKVDMFNLDANHIGHGGGIHKVNVGGAVSAVLVTVRPGGAIVVFPVFHEDANHFMALLLEQPGGHGRIHAATQAHHHALPFIARVHDAPPAVGCSRPTLGSV